MTEFRHEILPPNLAVKAMRSSGFKNSAYAIAELIDNSIQAGLASNICTDVEVICVDKVDLAGAKARQKTQETALYDNSCGMDAKALQLELQYDNCIQ